MNSRIATLIVLSFVGVFGTACNPALTPSSPSIPTSTLANQTPSRPEQTPEVTITPESKNQPTATDLPTAASDLLFLPQCDQNLKEGLLPETSPGPYQGWHRYTHEAYRFSLALPPDWELIEGQNFICLRPQLDPTVTLIVGFRQDIDDVPIQRTGVGEGDIFTTGAVNFLGQEISREVLRYEDKDKAILYNYATEIHVGELVFTLSLDDFGPDYLTVNLSDPIQEITDAIVESCEFTE